MPSFRKSKLVLLVLLVSIYCVYGMLGRAGEGWHRHSVTPSTLHALLSVFVPLRLSEEWHVLFMNTWL